MFDAFFVNEEVQGCNECIDNTYVRIKVSDTMTQLD